MSILVLFSYWVGTKIFIVPSIIGSTSVMSVADLTTEAHLNGMTMAFLTMNFAELFEAICMRSQRRPIRTLKTHNKYLLGYAILTILITIGVTYIPFFIKLFGFARVSLEEFIIAISIAALLILAVELEKILKTKSNKKKIFKEL